MQNCLDYNPDDTVEYIYDTDDYPSDVFDMLRMSRDNLTHNNYVIMLAELCRTFGIDTLNGRLHEGHVLHIMAQVSLITG